MTKLFLSAAILAVAPLAFAPITFAQASQDIHATHSSSTRTSSTRTKTNTGRTLLVPQLEVANQPLVNSTITIRRFTLDKPGWVMSHLQGKAGQPGTMAGVTGPFAPGTYRNVRIQLNGNIKAGDKVWPMLHYDEGAKRGVFEPESDHHVDVNGKTATRQITITAIQGTRPKPGALVIMPPCCMMDNANQTTTEKKVRQ